MIGALVRWYRWQFRWWARRAHRPAWLNLVTPNILLAFCFIVGTGMALMGPAGNPRQRAGASEPCPAAVALNGIS